MAFVVRHAWVRLDNKRPGKKNVDGQDLVYDEITRHWPIGYSKSSQANTPTLWIMTGSTK